MTRIQVLRGGAIGDFVLTLPALTALRRQWPAAYIELVGYPRIAQLAQWGGVVDRVESLDDAEVARFFSARPLLTNDQRKHVGSFDVVVSYLYDPSGLVKQNLLDAGAGHVIYGSPKVEDVHAADHLMRPLEELAIYRDGEAVPRLRAREPELAVRGRPYVVMHPGSGSVRKNWPCERFIEVAGAIRDELEVEVVFSVGEADGEIAEMLSNQQEFTVMQGMSLTELARVLSGCVGYVGNDSGITHLAAAVGVAVVAIFGASNKLLWSPRGDVRIVESCDQDGGECDIEVDDVIGAAASHFGR